MASLSSPVLHLQSFVVSLHALEHILLQHGGDSIEILITRLGVLTLRRWQLLCEITSSVRPSVRAFMYVWPVVTMKA